tara:strand:+ start:894 stop:1820 length:927 start_codon:yes stop_codon:yes gene_type:complete
MSWGKTATKEPEAPKYGREHMRAMLERQKQRANRTPVRMALVGKENTCKTGLALDLANVDSKKTITIFDFDNSARETVAHIYPKAKNIQVISLYDEGDESIFNDDNTTNWSALIDKVGWFVNLISEDITANPDDHEAFIFDGGSTFMKWCEFAMTAKLLERGTIKEEGDSFNQKEWRTRNQLFRDIINRVHSLPIAKVFFTFHLKDHKTYVDVGGGSKGLMKIGEKVDWVDGTQRIVSQQIFLARYKKTADDAAGVKGDDTLDDNEWVVRGTIEEMKGRGMELVGTTYDILSIKGKKVVWKGLPDLKW